MEECKKPSSTPWDIAKYRPSLRSINVHVYCLTQTPHMHILNYLTSKSSFFDTTNENNLYTWEIYLQGHAHT
jgi:hypothetical protein